MNNIITRSLTTAAVLAAFATPVALAAPALASGGSGGGVSSSGACAGGGVYKLKAKHDHALIQVEYEVDTNRVGQVWAVRITDNGATIYSGTVKTTAPSGSFTIHKATANRTGTDTIRAHATMGTHSCGGTVAL
jgi:hypothetical protein